MLVTVNSLIFKPTLSFNYLTCRVQRWVRLFNKGFNTHHAYLWYKLFETTCLILFVLISITHIQTSTQYLLPLHHRTDIWSHLPAAQTLTISGYVSGSTFHRLWARCSDLVNHRSNEIFFHQHCSYTPVKPSSWGHSYCIHQQSPPIEAPLHPPKQQPQLGSTPYCCTLHTISCHRTGRKTWGYIRLAFCLLCALFLSCPTGRLFLLFHLSLYPFY